MPDFGLNSIAALAIGAFGAVATGPLGTITLPDKDLDEAVAPATGWHGKLLAADGSSLGAGQSRAPLPVNLDALPNAFLDGIIVTEDHRFLETHGLDPIATIAAARDALRDRGRGGSGITQQLVKNTLTGGEVSIERKVAEAMLSLRLHVDHDHDVILRAYLENNWFGRSQVSAMGAADAWFAKAWQDLSLSEAAFLAGLPVGASRLDPRIDPDRAHARRDHVLRRMEQRGVIDIKARDEAMDAHLEVIEPRDDIDDWGFVAARNAMEQAGLDVTRDMSLQTRFGMEIATTLEPAWQEIISQTVPRAMADLDLDGQTQISVVALDPRDGAIIALKGSRDSSESLFDRSRSMRQPGSAIKPALFAAAIEAGVDPDAFIANERRSFIVSGTETWRPRNYDRSQTQPVPLYTGLERSFNIVAANLAEHVGVERFATMAEKMGVYRYRPMDRNLSAALGTSETRLRDLVAGYATFFNRGIAMAPRLLAHQSGAPEMAMSETTARIMQDMLHGVTLRGTAAPAFGGHPVTIVGKTGTTQDHVDALFVGGTPHLVIGVWVGRDDNTMIHPGATGGRTAAPIAADILEQAHEHGLIDADGLRDSQSADHSAWPPILLGHDGTRPAPQNAPSDEAEPEDYQGQHGNSQAEDNGFWGVPQERMQNNTRNNTQNSDYFAIEDRNEHLRP